MTPWLVAFSQLLSLLSGGGCGWFPVEGRGAPESPPTSNPATTMLHLWNSIRNGWGAPESKTTGLKGMRLSACESSNHQPHTPSFATVRNPHRITPYRRWRASPTRSRSSSATPGSGCGCSRRRTPTPRAWPSGTTGPWTRIRLCSSRTPTRATSSTSSAEICNKQTSSPRVCISLSCAHASCSHSQQNTTQHTHNRSVGANVDLAVPRNFWTRLASKYGTKFYWQNQGEAAAILQARVID